MKTTINLDEVRQRYVDAMRSWAEYPELMASVRDVPALCDEIERLRAMTWPKPGDPGINPTDAQLRREALARRGLIALSDDEQDGD